MKKAFVILIIGILIKFFTSCKNANRNNFKIYSPDKSQIITIITKDQIRYIINGDVENIPDSNFVKLDISQIDPVSDEIGICWNTNNLYWKLTNNNSKILENKLNTSKYKFENNWKKKTNGVPDISEFRKENCGTFDLLNMKIYKNRGLTIEN
ncbi:hypothetical protein [Christiangramia sabulilitoris]|uniref:Uncharacterized protein n=1 Tax=Christiangramia sabulilitoris TaxID=2583991 RepID=A0A550I722_9FLAO|nr:hypothetical protein [Christiangramia sabulilitoris]TRO66770.1 hypothetical protein FGM01_02450 [Christiangramia sabulilitoris]